MTDVITKVSIGGQVYPFAGWGSEWQELIYISQADYDNLTPAEKADATKNYVIIGEGGIPVPTDINAEDVDFDNTWTGMQSDNVQDAIDEVFQSVSNGKELLADAITDKGVQTSASDSFATMATNISNIETYEDVYNLIKWKDFNIDTYAYSWYGSPYSSWKVYSLNNKRIAVMWVWWSSWWDKDMVWNVYVVSKDWTYTKTTNFTAAIASQLYDPIYLKNGDNNYYYVLWRVRSSGSDTYKEYIKINKETYSISTWDSDIALSNYTEYTGTPEDFSFDVKVLTPWNDSCILAYNVN